MLCFYFKQAFIEGRKTTETDDLDGFMHRLGFTKRGLNRYQNSIIEVFDLHEANVLMGDDGNFYFIDTIPRLMDNKIYWDFIIK